MALAFVARMDTLFAPEDLAALRVLATSALLAAIIGLEREWARKPAGLRTHMLVGVAAALLMTLGDALIGEFANPDSPASIQSDPVRLIQAIIVGISFLGAGTIVHDGDARVEGLTTAASILLTAAVAIAVAIDRVALATVVAIGTASLLLLLGQLERRLRAPAAPRTVRDAGGSGAHPIPARRRSTPGKD
jgi:putative Mg2+ transporter-C (MgtC) family protein